MILDFDGTLAEIAPTPTDALLSEPRKRWLKDFLLLLQCSIGVVSGHPIDELKWLIGLEQIYYVGCHGLERAAPDGTFHMSPPNQAVVDARKRHERPKPLYFSRAQPKFTGFSDA